MKSWCDFALLDTLDNLQRAGIQTVGAGKNLAEALQPVVVTINGVRFGFVSLGDRKMDANIFAGPDYPGIANLTPENLQQAMSQVRKIADVVIALPHWGNEDNSIPSMLQRQQAGELIDAGADLIVGNHTHVVQAIDEIDGHPGLFWAGQLRLRPGFARAAPGGDLAGQIPGHEIPGLRIDPDAGLPGRARAYRRPSRGHGSDGAHRVCQPGDHAHTVGPAAATPALIKSKPAPQAQEISPLQRRSRDWYVMEQVSKRGQLHREPPA